jgi:phosphoribosylformimino-5-aminoimidazole carboxamide ribotide isomerase
MALDVAGAGWTQDSGIRFEPLVQRSPKRACVHLLCTDIARDGMLVGPEHRACTAVSAWRRTWTYRRPAASAMSTTSRARRDGCRGAVLGKALLEGRFTLERR